jgi:hypothetical protein
MLAISRLSFWLLVAALFVFATSCRTPVVGSLQVQTDTDSSIATTRFDGDTLLVIAHGQMTVEVFQKDGAQLFGPYTVAAGKIFLWSRSMGVKQTFSEGDQLPLWLRDSGILRPGDDAAFGLVFAPLEQPAQ